MSNVIHAAAIHIQALKVYDIPYASVYGDIHQDAGTGRLYFDGVHSTGCVFCCFGLHMESMPNRFQMMAKSHPRLYRYCMDKLGLRSVLDFMRTYCPDRTVRPKFAYEPYKQEQVALDFMGLK